MLQWTMLVVLFHTGWGCCQTPQPKRAPYFLLPYTRFDVAGPACPKRQSGKNACSRVTRPVDKAPFRASFTVIEHVATLVHGKSMVEIGSRNGDALDCLSHFARNTCGMEVEPQHCALLQKRAHESHGRFSVLCTEFPAPTTPNAEVYYTWVRYFFDAYFIWSFRRLQDEGAINASSQLIMGFAGGEFPAENQMWRQMQPFASSFAKCPYNDGKKWRQHGHPTVAVFQPSELNMTTFAAEFSANLQPEFYAGGKQSAQSSGQNATQALPPPSPIVPKRKPRKKGRR